jgi:hypothetical protein
MQHLDTAALTYRCFAQQDLQLAYVNTKRKSLLKGTVPRDFQLLFFFMNQFPPSP